MMIENIPDLEMLAERFERAARLVANAAGLNAAVAGMQAENEMRSRQGVSPAYIEGAFQMAAREWGLGSP